MTRIATFTLLAALAAGQAIGLEYESRVFLEKIRNSQELIYDEVVRHYDSLLASGNSPVILLEKCRFMESALYDPETEENPKYDEWDSCQSKLFRRHPDDIRVLAYRLEHTYGDSTIALAEPVLKRLGSGKIKGDPDSKAAIYKSLAYAYASKDSAGKALVACRNALAFQDSAKVHLLLAQQLSALGLKAEARKALLDGQRWLQPWENNNAGRLLLDMGFPGDAVVFYRRSLGDTASYVDNAALADAYEQMGAIDSARKFQGRALEKQYDPLESTRRQFEFDLRRSPGRAARESYRAFRDNGLHADPFSFYRLRLFALHPFQPVKMRELGGLALLFLMLLLFAAAPYLWVLPIHYLGTAYSAKHGTPGKSRFSLRHLWMGSSGILVASFLATGFFRHQLIDDRVGFAHASGPGTDLENTLFLLAFTFLLGLFTMAICIRSRAWIVFRQNSSILSIVGYSAACMLLFFAVKRLNLAIFPELMDAAKDEALAGSLMALLKSVLLTLGMAPTLLIVAILVPAYEEFLFRGIFQESAGRYFPFWIVNGLQASAFAAIHENLRLFPSYFVMGLTLGWLARRTGSLFLPVLVHSLNNALAVTVLWYLLQRGGQIH